MDVADASRVAALLTAAFPTYPMTEEATDLFVATMAEGIPDPMVAFAVVQDWITTRLTFPKIAEVLEEADRESARRARRARAIRAGQQHQQPGMVSCTACGDGKFEFHPYPDKPGYEYALPCRVCEPEWHQDWAEGHQFQDHDVDNCDWPRCRRRAAKRAGRKERYRPLMAEQPAERDRADVGPGF